MNNLASNAPGSNMFVTNVGLITSNGPVGPNIMTAAWTHHVSYEPPYIMVNIEPDDASVQNIIATKVFGINLASEKQNVISSIAGRYSGKNVDKIALLTELGHEFYDGKQIQVPMVKDAALNVELKLIKYENMGDHIIFIGEVLESLVSDEVKPIAFNAGKYWKVGDNISKPEQAILDEITALAEKFTRKM